MGLMNLFHTITRPVSYVMLQESGFRPEMKSNWFDSCV
jgi:hypothetical protein